jgi:hypothetical protein
VANRKAPIIINEMAMVEMVTKAVIPALLRLIKASFIKNERLASDMNQALLFVYS